jgi:hypothetical protein
MLFKEINTVHSEDLTEPIDTRFGTCAELSTAEAGGT